MSVGEREQWWDRFETSSNHWQKDKLFNGILYDYWETQGRTGYHWIRIYIKKGFRLRKLYLHVDPKELSKMPEQVSVAAGLHAHDLRDISTVS